MAEGKSVEYNHIRGIKLFSYNNPIHETGNSALPVQGFRVATSKEY